MNDEDLFNHKPRHGDRIRLRSELRKRRPDKKHVYVDDFTAESNREQSTQLHCIEDMRNPHREQKCSQRNQINRVRLDSQI